MFETFFVVTKRGSWKIFLFNEFYWSIKDTMTECTWSSHLGHVVRHEALLESCMRHNATFSILMELCHCNLLFCFFFKFGNLLFTLVALEGLGSLHQSHLAYITIIHIYGMGISYTCSFSWGWWGLDPQAMFCWVNDFKVSLLI